MIRLIKNSNIDNQKLSELEIVEDNRLDNFDFSKAIVRKPWGHEYLLYAGNEASIWALWIKKDAATSMHCHIHKKTVLIVVAGTARCFILNEAFELKEGDGLIFDKGVFHSTKAISEGGIIVLEVETPPKKTDLVRAKDNFGRELKGYELQNEMCFDLSEYERVFLHEATPDLHKKIGNMNICMKIIKNEILLKNHLINKKQSNNIILSGKLIDANLKLQLGVGDNISHNDFEKIKKLKIEGPLKILHVTKNILDFD